MKTTIIAALFGACSIGAWGCPPPAPVPPDVAGPDASLFETSPTPAQDAPGVLDGSQLDLGVDDALASPCARACARLVDLGCRDFGAGCASTCEHVIAERLRPLDPACVMSAKTREEVRKCPAIICR